jgi:hypothetical protein
MSKVIRKVIATLFLVVFFLPVVLIALAVEGINMSLIELTGRPLWNVGHIGKAYEALLLLERMSNLTKFTGLKASGDPIDPRNFN